MDFFFTKTNLPSAIGMLGGIDWNMIGQVLKGYKAGQKCKLSIVKVSKPKSLEQLGYYYAVILPEAVKAFAANEDYSLLIKLGDKEIKVELTLENMDYFLKLRYAAKTGVYVNKAEMNMAECAEYESWCINWLATWLKCHIPFADQNWRNPVKNQN